MAGNPSSPCPRRCSAALRRCRAGCLPAGHVRAAVEVAGCRAARPGCACSAGLRKLGGWPGVRAGSYLRLPRSTYHRPGRPVPPSAQIPSACPDARIPVAPPTQCPAGSSPLRPRHGRDRIPAGTGSSASLRYRRCRACGPDSAGRSRGFHLLAAGGPGSVRCRPAPGRERCWYQVASICAPTTSQDMK
jgi:hypothetical protein